jgi:hypothetical protein
VLAIIFVILKAFAAVALRHSDPVVCFRLAGLHCAILAAACVYISGGNSSTQATKTTPCGGSGLHSIVGAFGFGLCRCLFPSGDIAQRVNTSPPLLFG